MKAGITKKNETYNGINAFYAKDGKAWRHWLEKHGGIEKSVWLILYKKGSGVPSVYYREAVDEALCFGWIDSKPNKRDAESYYQFFSPRKPKSVWSKINKDRVESLTKEGRMHKTGLAAIEAAKKNGSWEALDEVETLTLPMELQNALAKNKKAAAHFAAFPKSVKKGLLQWINSARREETRTKRIAETVRLATENIRANQYHQPLQKSESKRQARKKITAPPAKTTGP